MKFGIFDYIDLRSEPLAQTYDERMVLLQAAEAAGFHGYHVTEHHATPLSATPSPAVFLAAAARETTRIRLGALLFLLPLYHPLRLLEELLMLDNLSKGRLDIGVGRGISPFEFAAFGEDIAQSDQAYAESLDIIRKGLCTSASITPARATGSTTFRWSWTGCKSRIRRCGMGCAAGRTARCCRRGSA